MRRVGLPDLADDRGRLLERLGVGQAGVHHREGLAVEAADADLEPGVTLGVGRHDPGVPVIPYLLGAGTDNKALSTLDISGYGFAPLRLTADLDFTGMFHGVDERVPLAALDFGKDVLTDLLATY